MNTSAASFLQKMRQLWVSGILKAMEEVREALRRPAITIHLSPLTPETQLSGVSR